jgi:hypothetical protein
MARPDQSYIYWWNAGAARLARPDPGGDAAALMSHLSAMINSTSTILTMDLYKRLLRPDDSAESLVNLVSGVALCDGAEHCIALWFSTSHSSLFVLIKRDSPTSLRRSP